MLKETAGRITTETSFDLTTNDPKEVDNEGG